MMTTIKMMPTINMLPLMMIMITDGDNVDNGYGGDYDGNDH